jgi:Family of unknown function (DUF5678)
MPSPLQKEFEYFRAHNAELLSKYNGKFVVIKDQQVIGDYDDELRAIEETRKQHELGTFLVQKVEPGDAGTSQTFHSRVTFAPENAPTA